MAACRKTWAAPCSESIPEEKREVYQRRVQAVDMYIDGYRIDDIEERTGIEKSHVSELFEKCISPEDNGAQRGYSALVPGFSCSDRERNNESNSSAGLFSSLLSTFPELDAYIVGNFRGDPKYTTEKAMDRSALFRKFLSECRNLGLTDDDYPFNTKIRGRVTFYRYLDDLQDEDLKASGNRLDKDAAQIQSSTGCGERYTRLPVNPYQCVQVDGHIIDIIYTTEVALDDGTVAHLECQRCWLFAVIDVATRCILGYSLSQEFNYNQHDVLRAVKDACSVHGAEEESSDILRKGGKGFPSLEYPELEHVLFDSVMLDNAKTHLSGNVVSKLTDILGCTMIFGAVATPETRGIVERFFRTLEMKGFHRLPSTTGSSAADIKRKEPEKAARKYKITFQDISGLMEDLIIEYNTSPHSSLYNRTPLQEMGEKLRNGFLPYIPSEKEQSQVKELLYLYKTVTVRGNRKEGRRPYISYMSARYRNDLLSSTYTFSGQRITIRIDPYDVSSVTGYLPDGKCLGILTATGEYGKIPHSLMSRKQINRFSQENGRKNESFSTPVTDYQEELMEKAKRSRKARTRMDIMKKEGGSPAVTDPKDTEILDMNGKSVSTLSLTHDIVDGQSEEDIYLLMKKIQKG